MLGYVTFYLGPFFPAIWILRRLQRRRPIESFWSRHPLISLAVLVYIIGFIYDACLEIFCVRAGLYIYSQVIPFGSVFAGKAYQFPLLWESSFVTVVMIPAAIMVYRDDTGKTVAEKLAQRVRLFARPTGARHVRGHVRDPVQRLRRATDWASPSSSGRRRRRRSPAPTRTPRPRCTTPTGSMPRTDSRARTSRVSGPVGCPPSPTAVPRCRPTRMVAAVRRTSTELTGD